MKYLNFFLVLCVSAVVLSGCLSTSKRPPDELAVIEGAPLWLPPNYELRPPGTNTPPAEAAKKALETPEPINASDDAPVDDWLLEQAGASERNPNIRTQLERDEKVVEEHKKKRSWLDKMTGRNNEPELKDETAK